MFKKDLTTALIPLVYFVSGAVSIAGVAATFFYKDELGLQPAQVALMATAFTIPWSIKPLYGLLSDRVPIWKLRRKPYLFLAGLLGAAGYWSLATWVTTFGQAFIAVMIYAVGLAIADVIADGIVAERSKSQKVAGKLQVQCRAALMIGALLVAYLSGKLVEVIGVHQVFMITGFLPLVISIFALFMKESPLAKNLHIDIAETWRRFKAALTPSLMWAVLFLFVWRSTPSTGGAYSYFIIDEFGFDPEFFGRLTLISRLGAIVGIVFFRKFLLSIAIKKLFIWIAIVSVLFGLPNIALVYGWHELIGISPGFLSLADEFISAPLTEIAMIPMMVMVARLCPKGIEATMFALLASIMNIALVVSDFFGSALVHYFGVVQATAETAADYSNFHYVLWIAVLSSLIPLVLIHTLPEIRAVEEIDPSKSALPQQPQDLGKKDVA